MEEGKNLYEQELAKLLTYYDEEKCEYYKKIIDKNDLYWTEKQKGYIFSVTEEGTNGK